MNPTIKERWVEALRSGDYEQGARRLSSAAGLCCLGVLCDLAVQDGIARWSEPDLRPPGQDGYEPYYFPGVRTCHVDELLQSDRGVLPKAIYQWAELPDANPAIPFKDTPRAALSQLNDGGESFATIARVIEQHL